MLAAIVPQSAPGILILPLLLALSLALGRLLVGPLKRTPTHSALERLLIYWLVGVIAFSWVGTILAALGLFKWWLVLGVLLAISALAVWRRRKALPEVALTQAPLQSTPWSALLALILVLVGAGWLFARPAESFLLTDDSAVYTIGGVVLSRTGSLFYEPDISLMPADPSLSATPWDPTAVQSESVWTPHTDFARQFFDLGASGILTRHFGPFYQWRIDREALEIGFLPLPKVWTALVVWLFGPERATWAAPFFGLAGLAALYAIARRLLSWRAGLVAAVLLGVSLPQVWFARFPISEIYTQALLLGGLYLAMLARQNAPNATLAHQFSLWSGLALAALTVLRFEAPFFLLPIAILLLIGWEGSVFERASAKSTWALSVGGVSLLGCLVSLGLSRFYVFSATLVSFSYSFMRVVIALLVVLISAVGLLWHRWPRDRAGLHRLLALTRKWLPGIVALIWIAWSLVALWQFSTRAWGSSLAGWLVQYWTRPGLLLSVIGALALLWQGHKGAERPELLALLASAALFLLLYSLNPFVNPVHPWAMRRMIPVIMPALALCSAGLLTEGAEQIRLALPSRPFRIIPKWAVSLAATLVFLVVAYATSLRTRPFLTYQERQGLWRQIEALAEDFPPGAVLLFDNGETGVRLTPVMEMVFGHPSFVLWDTETIRSDSKVVDRLVEAAMAQGRAVYLVITDGDLNWRPERWQLVSHKAQRIDTPTLGYVWGRPPGAADKAQHMFWVDTYVVLPAAEDSSTTAQGQMSEIPIGPGSYPYLQQGFYGFEVDGSGTVFRWTRSEAFITIPWPAETPNMETDFCLEFVVCGGRAPEAEATHLVVEAEGVELFRSALDKAFERRTLRLPVHALTNHGSPQLEIRLGCNAWKPADYGNAQDLRALGVMLYGVRLLPLDQCQ